ncbi:MAG: MbnH family di-heme enzyme [Solirubrobacterales bacterium]
MARDRGRDRGAAVPRRLLSKVLGLALAAVLAAGAVLYGLASAESVAPPRALWTWSLPQGFPQPRVPAGNPMSRGKVAIGHRLFYDVRLSGNGTQSCASCHRPELAFTDGRTVAVGSTGEKHPRNAQSLVNVVYHSTLTWANPALVSLESQMAVPLFGTNPVEMGLTDANKGWALRRLQRDRWYAKRFPRVFPQARRPLNWSTVVRSIAAFQRTIVSASSRYDRFRRGEAKLTASERRGFSLFMGEDAECHHCHGSFIFDDQTTYVGSPRERPKFHNTGLYNLGGTGAFPAPNRGVFEITGKPQDMGRFRAPSLRNVARTAPYMHDGSIATLPEAVDHYANGGRVISEGPLAGDGRANPYKDPLIAGIDLSPRDRADIVAFLTTLTERDFSKDPRFADPFKRRGS